MTASRARAPGDGRGVLAAHAATPSSTRALTLPRVAPWSAWLVCGLAAGAAWLALRAWAPGGAGGEPLCLLRSVAHVECPTCGLTRALALLARGEWRGSLALHPLALPLAVQLLAGWGAWGAALARGRAGFLDRWLPGAVVADACALLAVWGVRLATGTLPM
ncbi:MAG: DUF2752 domain-containing protein [Candidatus Eisenbacteria bacterium]|nr:DUF2752 domain-containing protein [Candidatus Eisenbacteria bacterium]